MNHGTSDAVGRVHEFLNAHPAPRMVILGGYDVVPPHQVNTLPSGLASDDIAMLRKGDPDQFIVWNDDPYVDIDGAGFPDIAISRIPDGHDTLFTLNALQATPSEHTGRVGLRNQRRPFVDAIFASLPGQLPMERSAPKTTAEVMNPFAAPLAYVMLHGKSSDATQYWGEGDARQYLEALSLNQIPNNDVPHDELDVVLLGCCWGALAASTPAFAWNGSTPIAGRLPAQSIALSMLMAGARGVVGCTGAHYSPIEAPFNEHSGPLHQAFWANILAGAAPADALFNAKTALARHIVTLSDVTDIAIASKTLAQFTCLGLGW